MQEEVKFKIGDKVRMPSKRPTRWNPSGEMDKYLNTTQTITQIDREWFSFEGDGDWGFRLDQVTSVPKFNYYIKKGD